MKFTALSSDSHINEPPDLFVKRVPEHLRERAPHVINLDNGGEAWVFEDVDEPVPLGLTAVNFRAQKRFDRSNYKEKFLEYRDGVQRGVRFEDILPGSWDAVARLGEQDEDHVEAEIMYQGPTVWAGVKATRDPELRLACFRAYNDWMAEFTAVAPDRLVGVGLVPDTGIDDAVAELHRCVDLGLRSVALESYPNGSWTEITREDDRFWAAAVERNTVVNLHATFSFPPNSTRLFAQGDSSLGALSAIGAFEKVAEQMIVTGVFDRFPTLPFVGAEVNCGWLPYWLEQFDLSYRRHARSLGISLEMLPSEYFRRNVYVTYIVDPVGVQARHLIGMANLMWCSDFPHSISNWPIDVEIAHAQMVGCNQAEIDRMMWRTAADLYGIPYDEPTLEPATASAGAAGEG